MANEEGRRTRRHWDRMARHYDAMTALAERVIGLARGRGLASARLRGSRILEVGAGTGKNVGHHPPGAFVVLTDVSGGMLSRARDRARREGRPYRFVVTDAEALAFKDGAFDAVLATCVFCSVPAPLQGLREVRRVLATGGAGVFLEHVRPPGLRGRLFDLLDPLMSRLMGPHVNRPTLETIQRAGLTITEARDVFSDWVKLVVARPARPPSAT
jgi:ubiquinone/menaquinone biosynthesis C-methylase UbiE